MKCRIGKSVYVKSVLSRLISVLDTNMHKKEEYKSLFLRTGHRSNRQFMAGVGVVLGAAAPYEVEAMKGTINELVTNQNLLVKQMVSVTNATVVTVKNVEKLRGAVDLINAHAVTMKHVTTLEACVMGISTQTSRFFSGLDTLLSGHLSLSLVKKNVAVCCSLTSCSS